MRGFTLIELIVVLAVGAILTLFAARWGDGVRRALAMEEAVSAVVSSLLSVEVTASAAGGAVLSLDPVAGSLVVERNGAVKSRLQLPHGVRFGFAPPPLTTGGDPVLPGDDGIHLDGRDNRRAFLGDGLPQGSLSLAVYLVESGRRQGEGPQSRAVTMSAPTGRIQVWRRSTDASIGWLSRG